MKQDCSADIGQLHILLRGALSLFEKEGSRILHILHEQDNYHARVFDHIGSALLLSYDRPTVYKYLKLLS